MLSLKTGANPVGMTPQIIFAIIVAEDIYADEGFDLVVTSINDSQHADTSRHWSGDAVDLRTREFSGDIARRIVEKLRRALPRHYLVLFESNHIHISYKPKKP